MNQRIAELKSAVNTYNSCKSHFPTYLKNLERVVGELKEFEIEEARIYADAYCLRFLGSDYRIRFFPGPVGVNKRAKIAFEAVVPFEKYVPESSEELASIFVDSLGNLCETPDGTSCFSTVEDQNRIKAYLLVWLHETLNKNA